MAAKKLELIRPDPAGTPSDPSGTPSRKLGPAGHQLWHSVAAEYAIEDSGGIAILLLTCEALDRAEDCRADIDRDAAAIRTKSGLKSHPLLRDELANRAFVTRCIALLGLDVEAIKPISRPPRFA